MSTSLITVAACNEIVDVTCCQLSRAIANDALMLCIIYLQIRTEIITIVNTHARRTFTFTIIEQRHEHFAIYGRSVLYGLYPVPVGLGSLAGSPSVVAGAWAVADGLVVGRLCAFPPSCPGVRPRRLSAQTRLGLQELVLGWCVTWSVVPAPYPPSLPSPNGSRNMLFHDRLVFRIWRVHFERK